MNDQNLRRTIALAVTYATSVFPGSSWYIKCLVRPSGAVWKVKVSLKNRHGKQPVIFGWNASGDTVDACLEKIRGQLLGQLVELREQHARIDDILAHESGEARLGDNVVSVSAILHPAS